MMENKNIRTIRITMDVKLDVKDGTLSAKVIEKAGKIHQINEIEELDAFTTQGSKHLAVLAMGMIQGKDLKAYGPMEKILNHAEVYITSVEEL